MSKDKKLARSKLVLPPAFNEEPVETCVPSEPPCAYCTFPVV
jgi:hypothetical protein